MNMYGVTKTKAYEVWSNAIATGREKEGARKAILCMNEAELRVFAMDVVNELWTPETSIKVFRGIMRDALED